MTKAALILASIGVVLVIAMLARRLPPQPANGLAISPPNVSVPAGAAERLAGAIQIPTLSHGDPAASDAAAFQALHQHLAAQFPRVHSELRRETVATHSLLYTWQGSDTSLKPVLLAAHLDVVPVDPGTQDEWQQPPFSGRIVDGFVWGRGAIDNKSAVMGTLEAVDILLREGFTPVRTVHLAFGHDEEVGGMHGARAIAALLEQRNVKLQLVLDEGGVIGNGVVPHVAQPVALVGIAEKGFLSLELAARAPGGHSSLPPRESAIGILGAAIARLEDTEMTPRLEGATRLLLETIGPHLPFMQRLALANLWLTAPLVLTALEQAPSTNAMVRTTMAATIFQAGTKDNVLPSRAVAVVNFRILPGDSIAAVVEHVHRAIDDSRVQVKVVGAFSAEPSDVSRPESASFGVLERAVGDVVPQAIVAPYQVVVATDSRHYSRIAEDTLRFLPLQLTPLDMERIHGTNERLAIRDYALAIEVYRQFIVGAAAR